MDVGIWLNGLGLEDYTEAFLENGVDTALLSELTNEDLKDLGVARLADRKRLLKEIAELSGRIGQDAPDRPGPTAPMGERRQVTVLFADLSNFTSLSSELDAEQTHALLNRYFETVDGIVEHYGGTVDKHIGDNVMAVFGAPIAHTDDPRRAVRAALDIHDSMKELTGALDRELSAHIGIASGQVVASGTGSDAHREYTVTGDTVNLASRLDDMAAAGETLISEAVWNAVSPIAICDPRGRVSVKGLSREIAVWAVQGLASEAAADRLAAFVGRRMELRQFAAFLDETKTDSKGHSLLVRGEPGIGKTRLIEELLRLARDKGFEPHKVLILDFGVAKGQEAIRALVRSLLAVEDESSEAKRRETVRKLLATGSLSKDRTVFLNDLLNLAQPAELRGIYDATDGAARKEGTRETVAELIRSAAVRRPVLIVVEDIHWADATTLDQLTGVARAALEFPILLTMTSRVEGLTLEQQWLASLRGCPLTTIEL